MKNIFFALVFLSLRIFVFGQSKQFTMQSNNTMFPDNKPNTKYAATDSRFNNNNTIVYVPKHFDKNKPWQFFLWFHGWNNNIERTLEQFKLREQLEGSGINAILVMPEGARDAQDSYCGKWEQPNYFNDFMGDVKQKLAEMKVVDNTSGNHPLIIAGHSGAAVVLVQIMDHANIPINGMLLFDAISANVDKIVACLQRNINCKLINLYTDRPNTSANSKKLVGLLKTKGLCILEKEDQDFSETDVTVCRVLSLHTQLSHNDVATSNNYIKRFLTCVG
jgi:hypothetical protein